jgi:D-alanine-D-alanine ligase
VKPNFEGSSKGISEQSVVAERGGLEAALAAGLALYPEGILVEQFIPGTDVTVGFVERQDPEILTPCSYEIAAAWMNRYRIYDYRLKNVAPDEVVQPVCPARVPPEIRQVVARHAQSAVKALGLRGLARLDFRVRDDGAVFFVEANATPSLEPGSSIFIAARVAGRSYGEVIAHLISHAAA